MATAHFAKFTQQALAEKVGMHISQIRRYESGQSQPTLDVIRKLAVALSVSADLLLFEKDERGPDEELKLQFEAVVKLDPEEKRVIRSVIESMILRHDMRRNAGRAWDDGLRSRLRESNTPGN
jgi:transcriptional regulator with XRE-family HTH domain